MSDPDDLDGFLADCPAITRVVIDAATGLFAVTFDHDPGSTILLDRTEVLAVSALLAELTDEVTATGQVRMSLRQAIIHAIGRDPWRHDS